MSHKNETNVHKKVKITKEALKKSHRKIDKNKKYKGKSKVL